MKNCLSALMLFALLTPAAYAAEEEEPKKPAIEWEEVDAAEFAAKLEKASAAGEKWAASPESIILEYVGPFISDSGEKAGQSRTIRINSKGEELPKVLMVVLVDDGLFDDSIKTSRKRLALKRGDDGKWQLRKAFRSWVKWPR